MEYSIYMNEFLIYVFAMFMALLSPGPDFAMILKQSITYGKRASIIASIGIGCGVSVHLVYTLLGIGLIISQSIVLFSIIKYLGAAYLIYIGYQSLKSSGMKLEAQGEQKHEYISDRKSFMMGFLCNALNPKATLFFLSMFTVVVSPTTPLEVQAGYGLFSAITAILWFVALSLILSLNKVRNFFNSFGKMFDKAIGAVLISLGISVALSK